MTLIGLGKILLAILILIGCAINDKEHLSALGELFEMENFAWSKMNRAQKTKLPAWHYVRGGASFTGLLISVVLIVTAFGN